MELPYNTHLVICPLSSNMTTVLNVRKTNFSFVSEAYFAMINFLLLCLVWKGVHSQDQWILQRTAADESRVIFKNTTVTGDFMMCAWTWRDSLGGVWDTRIRVSFKNDSYRGGGFDYRDGYGRELLRVGWHESMYQNLTWKTLFSNKFPPLAWNMSNVYLNWGYMPISEYSWSFTVDNYTIEPKPALVQSNKLTNPYIPTVPEFLVPIRKKRSYQSERQFNIIDLFTGNGIFSQVPQMLINVFSFVSSLFPAGSNDYEVPDDYSTEPEAEIVTPTTPLTTAAAASQLRRNTTPRL